MGCSPSQQRSEIIEVKKERASSNRATVSSTGEQMFPQNVINQINISLFIIGEENSKFEESRIPSNMGTILSPQMTENFKDN